MALSDGRFVRWQPVGICEIAHDYGIFTVSPPETLTSIVRPHSALNPHLVWHLVDFVAVMLARSYMPARAQNDLACVANGADVGDHAGVEPRATMTAPSKSQPWGMSLGRGPAYRGAMSSLNEPREAPSHLGIAESNHVGNSRDPRLQLRQRA